MKTDGTQTVPVVILGKEYWVRCPDTERERLERLARFVDEKMREVRDSGAALGTDRIAVLTALNIANELFDMQDRRREEAEEVGARTSRMLETVQRLLDEEEGEGGLPDRSAE
ncbi:cell division protein ZapA [Thiohalorhabdus methylotrophus]|uniref:Cell division protein ZapA n=1 Tax=Thiohalorhabdus methylotrophus TaxID=3242694 RepID=A0ABV4TVM5_9GAMM